MEKKNLCFETLRVDRYIFDAVPLFYTFDIKHSSDHKARRCPICHVYGPDLWVMMNTCINEKYSGNCKITCTNVFARISELCLYPIEMRQCNIWYIAILIVRVISISSHLASIVYSKFEHIDVFSRTAEPIVIME